MKAILFSAAAGWLARLLAILLNLVGTPIVLAELGPSRFGLLLVILSISSWIGFANVGMGRVIANTVARTRRSTSAFKTETVSLATALSAVINLLLFGAAAAALMVFMWMVPVNETILANYSESIVTVLVVFFGLALWFFLSIFEGIDAGHHQLHRLYLFQVASYAVSFALLLFVFPAHPSIVFAAVLLSLGFLFGSVFHALDVVRRNRDLFSSEWRWKPRIARRLLLSSVHFTIISLGIGILYQLATGLFGLIAGPDAVIELGIFMRLMQSYGGLVVAFTYPLSNILATKLKMRDELTAARIVRLSGAVLLAGSCLGGGVFWLFGNLALSIWLRTTIELDRLFLTAAALLVVLSALQFFFSALLIGTSNIREAARLQVWQSLIYVPIACVLFKIWGQEGVLLAMDAVMSAGLAIMIRCVWNHPVIKAAFMVQLVGRTRPSTTI
ncbi:hypothetical protein [Bradyrhizobium japonicum]|uniref:hypothetical protein n=1 Tax=Bradyrhizobium japonicum TaxID=375 RepID=UPI0003FB991E|nr:hypothetical protein [Bradyrhizobium japonicum]